VTVRTKLWLALADPSLTVRVIVEVPYWPATGVTVAVRLAPLPPRTMLLLGTRVGLEESPESVRLAAGVSESPMVKLRGNEVFSGTV
jgi:hypothetical protein